MAKKPAARQTAQQPLGDHARQGVVYARISPRKMQANAQGVWEPVSDSIEDQIAACRQLAASRQITIAEEPYIDRLKTGRKPRKNFDLALQAAAQHQGALLCYDLSRCYRSLEHMLTTIAFCERWNVPIITVMGDGFDPTGGLKSSDRLMAQVLGAVNEYMARQKSERVKAACYSKRHDRASYGGGKLPYGLRKGQRLGRDYRLLPVRAEVEIVCFLLYCRRRKISLELASQNLNEAGMFRRDGRPWNKRRANQTVLWWKRHLTEASELGALTRRALKRCQYAKYPWKLLFEEPPRQYRLKGSGRDTKLAKKEPRPA